MNNFMHGLECYICHEENPNGRYQSHEGRFYFCGKHTHQEVDDWQSQPAMGNRKTRNRGPAPERERGPMSQIHLPYEKRRLLYGDDPQGYKLRDWPTNQRVVRAAEAHEMKTGHVTTDLMDDTPEGDVACGICCYDCDWAREFPYSGLRIPKSLSAGGKHER